MINIYSLGFILFVIEKKLHKLIMLPKVLLNGTNIFKMWFFNKHKLNTEHSTVYKNVYQLNKKM